MPQLTISCSICLGRWTYKVGKEGTNSISYFWYETCLLCYMTVSSAFFFHFLYFFSWLDCIIFLADRYLSLQKPNSSTIPAEWSRPPNPINNGFVNDANSLSYQSSKEEAVSYSTASEPSRLLDPRLEGSKRPLDPIAALKELVQFYELYYLSLPSCSAPNLFWFWFFGVLIWYNYCYIPIRQGSAEGLSIFYQSQPHLSATPSMKNEVCAQVSTLLLYLAFFIIIIF